MTQTFNMRKGVLHCEEVSLKDIARQFGTPTYVYSKAFIEQQWKAIDKAFGEYPHQICYAVKASSNIAILQVLTKLGSGFEIVSGGELERVHRAGADLGKVVFSGVGKTAKEIEQALQHKIRRIHVESIAELKTIAEVASHLGKQAMLGIRINPGIDAHTHPYLATGLRDSKFGVDFKQAEAMVDQILGNNHLNLKAITCHIGSLITQLQPFAAAVCCMVEWADGLAERGVVLEQINFGGGFPRSADAEPELAVAGVNDIVEYMVKNVSGKLWKNVSGRPWEIEVEPGRAIVADSAVLLTKVEYLKQGEKNFAVVDAAMNDLIRPALYQAEHELRKVCSRGEAIKQLWDVVGPVCESSDFLAHECNLSLRRGDLLAVLSAGAYGFSMASNYNSRPRGAEVLVDKTRAHLIRKRETLDDLMKDEYLLSTGK